MGPAFQPLRGQASASLAGCWKTSSTLGPMGTTEAIEQPSPYRTIILDDSGHVYLPLLAPSERSMWNDRRQLAIGWRRHHDPDLHRAPGMDSIVRPFPSGFAICRRSVRWPPALGSILPGTATYLTDAIVPGAAPIRVPVSFASISCEPSWPSVKSSKAPPAVSLKRRDPVYFDSQVDVRARLRSGSITPPGATASRPASDDIRLTNPLSIPPGIERVVLQFVIDSSGVIDMASLKQLSTQGGDYLGARRERIAANALRTGPSTTTTGRPARGLAIRIPALNGHAP